MKTASILHHVVVALLACVLCGTNALAQGFSDPTDQAPPEQGQPDRVETGGIIVAETKDGVSFYSKPLGKWSNLKLSRPADGGSLLKRMSASFEVASLQNGNVLYGFSSRTGRWAKLALPDDYRGPVSPELGLDTITIRLGDEIHVFSANTGEWSSPDSAKPVSDEKPTAFNSTPPPQARGILGTPEAKRLVKQLQAQESAAASEAELIRQLPANGPAEPNQRAMAEHQRKLTNLLSTAFDLKLQLEELQVQELQSRLSQLDRQIGQRKQLREKIIARRATELIEGEALKWSPDGSPVKPRMSSVTGGAASAVSKGDTTKAAAPVTDGTTGSGAERKESWPDVHDDPWRSVSPYASYQDLTTKLAGANDNVALWKNTVQEAEQLAAKGEASPERLLQVRNALNEALRKQKPIRDEYAATLRDLELQIASAQIELDAATQDADGAKQLVEMGGAPQKVADEAQRRLKQAKLSLERLKVRHNLYKKAGEGLLDGQSKGEAKATGLDKPPASEPRQSNDEPPQSKTKSLDEWLTVLRDSRDKIEVNTAIREVAKLTTSANSERIAPVLFATAEFFDFSGKDDWGTMIELWTALGKLDPAARATARVNALRDGHPRVKLFVLNAINTLNDRTAGKDFPLLVEQILKLADSPDLRLRTESLRLLIDTLPITRLDPAEFSTEERREMARRLIEHAPRDRVLPLLVTALSDKQIDVALAVAAQIAQQPAETFNAEILAKEVDVLVKVTKGKLGDLAAVRDQRALALFSLTSLKSRAAPAIPMLIELLKSDDPDLKPVESPRFSHGFKPFTRDEIIKTRVEMGPVLKDSLPDLEAALVILGKKQKEDALLTPNERKFEYSTSDRLRAAINEIKNPRYQRGIFGF